MKERFLGIRPLHARTLRELIEVLAIVLAGLWALYVFVYENRIRPALQPPTPIFSVAMHHVGNDGGLAVVQVDESIRNPGSAAVYFLGHSLTVLGSNVIPLDSPAPEKPQPLKDELQAFYVYSHPRVVYRNAFVTLQGDPRAGSGLFLQPGQTATFSEDVYVPRRRFDHLTAWIRAAYLNTSTNVPTTLTVEPSGLPQFHWQGDVPVFQVSTAIAQLDLVAQ